MKTKTKSTDLAYYEGLVHKTAYMLVSAGVELEQEDVEQILWIKVFKALRAFKPEKTRMPLQNYVFMCLRDQAKDLGARKRYGTLSIDAIREDSRDFSDGSGWSQGDRFDAAYLSIEEDDEYVRIENFIQVPNTLTSLERQIVMLLYWSYQQTEVAAKLQITKRDVERSMRSIRTKMADWKPSRPDDHLADVVEIGPRPMADCSRRLGAA